LTQRADTLATHGIEPGRLSLHADRGTSMTSKPVAQLLVDLGVARSHSRPHVSNDNPYSEANFKTLKYGPAFPGRFGSIHDARAFCSAFFDHYNHVHRHAGIGLHTPASVHYGTAAEIRTQRAATLDAAYTAHPGPLRALPTDPAEAAHHRLDQRTHPRSTHQIRITSCLTGLDRFRHAGGPCQLK
jgi:putative transposase